MPFTGFRPNGLKPLALDKKIRDYKNIYNDNHKIFCQRFIDTLLSYYMDDFMERMVKDEIALPILIWGIWETDMFLWKIRDILDTCMDDDDYVMNVVRSEFVPIAIEDFFSELVNENNNIKQLAIDIKYMK